MTTGRMLCALEFETTSNWHENLKTLLAALDDAPQGALLVAPEVCLTDFAYDFFSEAAHFSTAALDALTLACCHKTLVLTLIEAKNDRFFNVAYVIHNGTIVHKQAKHKLFTLGDETRHFQAGALDEIAVVNLDGLKVGILICFELRFVTLWEKLKGADVICIPARWGSARSSHLMTLSQALAIANQCYVIVCDAQNNDCSQFQAVITPFGDVKEACTTPLEPKLLAKMRRYIDIGFF